MPRKAQPKAADYIAPLYMNGMQGRMLRMPAPPDRKREILFVYGHHSSLERWWGVIQDLNQYGAVTVPDLPGFGGMDSFYKIGEKPTLDNMADYLAAFIKLRYNRRRVTVVGLSFGFVVITRMLQRYPDLVKKVDLLVSVVGFSHHEDFKFSKPRYYAYLTGARFFSYRLPAVFFKNVILHPWLLRTFYGRTNNAKHKFKDAKDKESLKLLKDIEVDLWHSNEVRTYMNTTIDMLTINNCNRQIDLPVWHVSVKADQYFHEDLIEQHMRVIFSGFHRVKSKMSQHAPSVIADVKTAAPLFPPKLRRILSRA
jgi:pimeloyl-ACP methyl ester carboxylesterase